MSPKTITPELVTLDPGSVGDKSAVIRELAARVVSQGRATDADALYADAWAREQKDETGLPGGIAIPHAKSPSVTVPTLAFARLEPGVDFGAPDGPADLVFLIAAPADAAEAHLAVLSKLARSLMTEEFTAGLRAAATPEDVVALVDEAIGEGDGATGTWYLHDRVLVPAYKFGLEGAAFYSDRYVRTPDGWRIAWTSYRRTYEMTWNLEDMPSLKVTGPGGHTHA